MTNSQVDASTSSSEGEIDVTAPRYKLSADKATPGDDGFITLSVSSIDGIPFRSGDVIGLEIQSDRLSLPMSMTQLKIDGQEVAVLPGQYHEPLIHGLASGDRLVLVNKGADGSVAATTEQTFAVFHIDPQGNLNPAPIDEFSYPTDASSALRLIKTDQGFFYQTETELVHVTPSSKESYTIPSLSEAPSAGTETVLIGDYLDILVFAEVNDGAVATLKTYQIDANGSLIEYKAITDADVLGAAANGSVQPATLSWVSTNRVITDQGEMVIWDASDRVAIAFDLETFDKAKFEYGGDQQADLNGQDFRLSADGSITHVAQQIGQLEVTQIDVLGPMRDGSPEGVMTNMTESDADLSGNGSNWLSHRIDGDLYFDVEIDSGNPTEIIRFKLEDTNPPSFQRDMGFGALDDGIYRDFSGQYFSGPMATYGALDDNWGANVVIKDWHDSTWGPSADQIDASLLSLDPESGVATYRINFESGSVAGDPPAEDGTSFDIPLYFPNSGVAGAVEVTAVELANNYQGATRVWSPVSDSESANLEIPGDAMGVDFEDPDYGIPALDTLAFEPDGGIFDRQTSPFNVSADTRTEDINGGDLEVHPYWGMQAWDFRAEEGFAADRLVFTFDLSGIPRDGVNYSLYFGGPTLGYYDPKNEVMHVNGEDWINLDDVIGDPKVGLQTDVEIVLTQPSEEKSFYYVPPNGGVGLQVTALAYDESSTNRQFEVHALNQGEPIDQFTMENLTQALKIDYAISDADESRSSSLIEARTREHEATIGLDLDAYAGDTELTASLGPADEARFSFGDRVLTMSDAQYVDQLVQIFWESGDFPSLNNELFDDYGYGHPDASYFTVTGSDGRAYTVEQALLNDSVLLELDRPVTPGTTLTVTYAKPSSGDQVEGVVQTWTGVDVAAESISGVDEAPALAGTLTVEAGATLGWSMLAEEGRYLSAEQDGPTVTVTSQANNTLNTVVDFGFSRNPHLDHGDRPSNLTDGAYARTYLDVTVTVPDEATYIAEENIPLEDFLAPGFGDFTLWHSYFQTADDSSGTNANSPQHLATFSVPQGVPTSTITGGFLLNGEYDVTGSDADDVLGDPTFIGSARFAGEAGDDVFIAPLFAEHQFDGGSGEDTFIALASRADVKLTGGNSQFYTLDYGNGAKALLRDIETIQFDDVDETLQPFEAGFIVTALDPSTSGMIATANQFEYLDLRGLIADRNNDEISDVSYVLASDIDRLILTGADSPKNEYTVEGFNGFIVSGSDMSSLQNNPSSLRFSQDANDIVVVASGQGLRIEMGDDVGSGSDILSFHGTSDGVVLDLSDRDDNGWVEFTVDTQGAGEVRGGDIILGSHAADIITGYSDRFNLLSGFDGDDTLDGGSLADILIGGEGEDILNGRDGDDILIDLDAATLTGGQGNDIFVVRGDVETSNGDIARITDMTLSSDGIRKSGISSTDYTDRIVFALSASAIAAAAASLPEFDLDAEAQLDLKNYAALRDKFNFEFEDISSPDEEGSVWRMEAKFSSDHGELLTLGRVEFSVDPPVVQGENGVNLTIDGVVLGQAELLNSVHAAMIDHALRMNDPVAENAGGDLSQATALDDTVFLTVGLYARDQSLVELKPNEEPILLPALVEGVEIATRFQSSQPDEVMVGSRMGDSYEFVKTVFTDAVGEPVGGSDQSMGTDLIIERGLSKQDTSKSENRDVISFAEVNESGLGVLDLLVGDLTLVRDEIGREGPHRSLKIEYDNAGSSVESPETKLNDVAADVFLQYAEDSNNTFRIEDLQLLDSAGVVTRFDLGVTDVQGNVSTSGGRDAILVGSNQNEDEFQIDVTEITSGELDVFFVDFDLQSDHIGIITTGSQGDPETSAFNAWSEVTTGNMIEDAVGSVTIENGPTINMYFIDRPAELIDWDLLTSSQ